MSPARSLFLSPQPPHNTKAFPQHKEASAEERESDVIFGKFDIVEDYFVNW